MPDQVDPSYQANHKRPSLATSDPCAPCIMECVFTALYGICVSAMYSSPSNGKPDDLTHMDQMLSGAC